jgi:hypothetical protein
VEEELEEELEEEVEEEIEEDVILSLLLTSTQLPISMICGRGDTLQLSFFYFHIRFSLCFYYIFVHFIS